MKCHWFTDKDGNRQHIPMCSTMVFQGYCSCEPKKDRVQVLEEKVERLERKIKKLENNYFKK